jgi:polysaccharide export outer membrane protein
MLTKLSTSICIVGLLLAGLAGSGRSLGAQQAAAKIAPRDALVITVWGQPTMSGKFSVGPDGTFEFPPIGRVKAVGLVIRDIEADIKGRLAPDYLINPQVTIELEQAAVKKVSISGEVRQPGVFPYGGEMRLLEALTRAGSVNESAGDSVLVLHAVTGGSAPREEDAQRVDLLALMAGDRNANILLADGDTVIVKKAEPVYVTGYVVRPGAYTVPRGATVLQALTLAGNISELGSVNRIELTRVVGGKKEKPRKVKLTDTVEPGDTISVGRRFW